MNEELLATTHEYEVIIVGAGPAGMCAALYTGRSMLRTAVLERGMPGGELLNTEKLDDWIGEKSILGWELAQSRSVLLIDLNLQFGDALAFVHAPIVAPAGLLAFQGSP